MTGTFPRAGLGIRLFALATCSSLAGAAEEPVDFEKEILPVFQKHCAECHGSDLSKPKAGFIFDTPESIGKHVNTDRHKAFFVPGRPDISDMMTILTLPGSEREAMPPGGNERVPAEAIQKIKTWVEQGATFKEADALAFMEQAEKNKQASAEKLWTWTNKEGKTLEARFIRREGGKVLLQREGDAEPFEYDLRKLNDDSRLQAFRLSEQAKR